MGAEMIEICKKTKEMVCPWCGLESKYEHLYEAKRW